MQCPECGAQNPEVGKFCLNCGAPLALVCPQCGAELGREPDIRFCFACGTPVGTPAPAQPSQAVAERLQRLVPRDFAERLLGTRGRWPASGAS